MSRWIKVTFHDTSDTHKLRNCTEEMSLAIGRSSFGVLSFDEAGEIGFAHDYVRIVNVPARQLRRAKAFVEQLLAKHFYDRSTTITSGRMQDLGG
jgi:hypothetical protein